MSSCLAETGADKVVLVGHSAGGWLARATLADGQWEDGVASEDVVAGEFVSGAALVASCSYVVIVGVGVGVSGVFVVVVGGGGGGVGVGFGVGVCVVAVLCCFLHVWRSRSLVYNVLRCCYTAAVYRTSCCLFLRTVDSVWENGRRLSAVSLSDQTETVRMCIYLGRSDVVMHPQRTHRLGLSVPSYSPPPPSALPLPYSVHAHQTFHRATGLVTLGTPHFAGPMDMVSAC